MHNIKDIRKNFEYFSKKIAERNVKLNFKELMDLDKTNRELLQNKEKLEQEKKNISKSKDEKNFQTSKDLSAQINLLSDKQTLIKKKLDHYYPLYLICH